MKRFLILVALLASLAVASFAATQPNILHILADDMGWTALSCYGNKDVATPNLDRLAAQGMRFSVCRCAMFADPRRLFLRAIRRTQRHVQSHP